MVSRRKFLRNGASLVLGSLLWAPKNPFSLLGTASGQAAPSNRKRIYIAADDHTDFFWTASEPAYRESMLRMLDYYLDLADQTASNPSEYQSRWNCDGSYWIRVYSQNRTPAQFERLMQRVRDGHISFPLNALALSQGATPAEAVLRGMYYPGKLQRKHNLPPVLLAVEMENQTLPLGLGALWAGAGAKYSWKGICGCDTQVSAPGSRPYEIYWWQGLDGSRILMKWNSLMESNQGMGGYAEARDPYAIVDYIDKNQNFKERYPYDIIGAFGYGWDDLESRTNEFVDAAQSESNGSRQVIVSNEVDFFKDFEATYGPQLPSLSCSFGNEWELYIATLAEPSASVKRSLEKLRGAEALAYVATTRNRAFMSGREVARDLAFFDLGLYWEHDFGVVEPPNPTGITDRIAWQRRLAGEIQTYVDQLHSDAATALGGLISNPAKQSIRFFVFNPLSWTRTDYADFRFEPAGPFHVIDLTTGQEAPSQTVTVGGNRFIRILAAGIPGQGYKVFEIQPGAGQPFADGPSADAASGLLENDLYRLTVSNRGAVTSWLDKQRANREFVRVLDGSAVNDLGNGSGTIQVENTGPVSVTLLVEANAPKKHRNRVTLYRSLPRIDLYNEITQNFTDVQTWKFSFAIDNPEIWHEEVGAILKASLVKDGGHYANSIDVARYDWLTLNHFADVSNIAEGVTLSNADCFFMKVGSSTLTTLDTSQPKISVLAGGAVANGNNGLPNQGGDSHFLQRFALQSHGTYNPAAAMRFALEHQNPLVTGAVFSGQALPEKQAAFLAVSNPNVLVWALKPAEDDPANWVTLRVWNMALSRETFTVSIPGGRILNARYATHIETPIEDQLLLNGTLTSTLNPQQMKTYLLHIDWEPWLDIVCKPEEGIPCCFLPCVGH